MISTWVDFKAVKQSVSMEMAMAHYGVKLRRIHGPYLRGALSTPKSHVERQCAELDSQHRKEGLGVLLGFLRGVRGGRTGGMCWISWLRWSAARSVTPHSSFRSASLLSPRRALRR